MRPTVSIAMTTFNGVEYLARQLDSIARQTYQPLEIIISDDGSTDGTIQELERLQQTIPFKLFTRHTPLGVNANFAFAFQHCSGDLIAIADQDDIWELDKIESLVAAIGDNDAIFSDSSLIDENDESLGATIITHLLKGSFPIVGKEPFHFVLQNVVSGHALLFRRRLLSSALPFTNHYYYDQQLAIVASLGMGVAYLNRALVRHRQHSRNACNHLISKVEERSPRRARAIRMASHLREGIHYVLEVASRMSLDTPQVRRMRSLSDLLDAEKVFDRWALFFHVMRNRKKLFPYKSSRKQWKLARRMIKELQYSPISKAY